MKYIKKYCKEIWNRLIIPIILIFGAWLFAIWFANVLLNILVK